ncbi:hypothetical protein BSKO_08261 [Bryopsis sp. KO-2023]|nr:hypothetical protein BSKO_08261 [Bryopsis sp. KO-2023]
MAPIPERRSLRRELRSGFYRRLWNSTKASPSSLGGVVRCAPDTAPAGPLTQHSGLSRAQQLIVLSTLKLPVLPIVFQQHGGVSLDRALPLVSGYNWWSAMLLRIKLQQYLENRRGSWRQQVEQLGKGEHYSVCLKGRGRLGRNTTIDATAEAQNVSDIHRAWTNRTEDTATGEIGPPENRWEGLSARLDMTHKLKGHKIVLGGAVQDRFQCQGRVLCVPGILSAEVASDRQNLHYKLGVHEVFGETTAGAAAGAGPGTGSGAGPSEHEHLGGHYLQGGIGMDGVLTVCGGNRRRRPKRAKSPDGSGGSADTASTGSSSDDSVLGFIASAEEDQEKPSSLPKDDIHSREGRNVAAPMRGGHVESDSPTLKTVADSQRMLHNLTEQLVAVKQFSKDLLEATQQVRTGTLVRMLANDGKTGRRGRHRGSPRFFLPNPHLKVGGLIGVTGSWRVRPRPADASHSHVDLHSSSSAGPSASSGAGLRLVRLSAAKDAAAKVFLGGSVSAQIGHMKRPFLNFSSLLAQLELGIPVPWLSGQLRRGRMQGVRSRQNLTTGITKLPFVPVLNLSVAQQVIGPLRVKADYKFSLDSRGGALGATNRGPMGVLVDHVQNIQPSLLDVQYGADISIPGTHGAVRFGGWYAPSRKEGMLEFRMM